MVPLSAHALFARPMVVAPTSVIAVEVLDRLRRRRRAVVRRPAHRRPPAGRAGRGPAGQPARSGSPGCTPQPFTDRLVAKFALPVTGLAGSSPQARVDGGGVIEEIRIRSLGVIEESGLELGPGFTAITGETGAGQDHGRHRAGAAARGPGRLRRGAGRARARPGSRARADAGLGRRRWRRRFEELGAEVDDGALVVARQVAAEGRSRAYVGGRRCPGRGPGEISQALVAVHGQSDQHRLQSAGEQRDALDRYAGAARDRPFATGSPRLRRLRAVERELDEMRGRGPGAGPRGRPAPLRARGDRGGRSAARRGRRPGGRGGAARLTPTRCGPPPSPRAGCSPATRRTPTRWTSLAAARAPLEGGARPRPGGGRSADRLAEASYLVSDLAADAASYAAGLETDPARLGAVVRAAGRADGTDPQVRRGSRGRAGVGQRRPRPALAADRQRRPAGGRPGGRSGCVRPTWRSRRPTLADRADAAERLAERGHRRAGRAGHAACAAWPSRLAAVAGPRRVSTSAGGPVGRVFAHGLDEVEFLLAANAGTEPRPLAKRRLRRRAVPRLMLALEVVLAAS